MPLVSYAVARRSGAICTSHRTPQLTVPLPKYNGPTTRHAHPSCVCAPYVLPVVATVLMLIGADVAHAQRVTGPWEDGSVVPRGVLRIGISPRFGQWKERHDRDGSREPLGALFTRDSLGPATFPFLAGLAPSLAVLTGVQAPPLSLGTLRTKLDVTEVTTFITLDYGLTSRVGLQAVIPYVKNRVHVSAFANETGLGATLGLNPARSITGARQQNELVVTALGTAATTLSTELTRCLASQDASCSAINANRQGAITLVQLAGQVSGAVAAVYGTTTATGALFAPVAGSALHTAVNTRLTELNAQFRAFLGAPMSGEWIAARPTPAVPIAAAEFGELLGSPDFGIAARPLGDYEHSHLGDIEIGAKFLLIDTFGPGATSPLPRAGSLRLGGGVVYRLPTGQLDLPDDFTDVGTGDRQADIELRGYGDVALGPRFWMSSVLRLGIQRSDRLVRRVADPAIIPFPELARAQEVDRDLGDVMELELAPRYVPNDEFAVSGWYRYRTKGADRYGGQFQVSGADGTPLTLDASVLGIGTEQTEHALGFAVTFSTVRGYARRTTKWPLEISYVHTQVMSGRGVPRIQTNGIAFRFYRARGNDLRVAGSAQR